MYTLQQKGGKEWVLGGNLVACEWKVLRNTRGCEGTTMVRNDAARVETVSCGHGGDRTLARFTDTHDSWAEVVVEVVVRIGVLVFRQIPEISIAIYHNRNGPSYCKNLCVCVFSRAEVWKTWAECTMAVDVTWARPAGLVCSPSLSPQHTLCTPLIEVPQRQAPAHSQGPGYGLATIVVRQRSATSNHVGRSKHESELSPGAHNGPTQQHLQYVTDLQLPFSLFSCFYFACWCSPKWSKEPP